MVSREEGFVGSGVWRDGTSAFCLDSLLRIIPTDDRGQGMVSRDGLH